MPRFSVCINAYNAEAHLKNAIDSVLAQDFDDYELLVLDDASTDQTAALIKKYVFNNNHVKGIFKEENEGLYLGRKAIVDACEGEFTVFLDADDVMEEGLLRSLERDLLVNDVDMFHYGIKVKGFEVDDETCASFENYVNKPVENLHDENIVDAVFGGSGEYVQDWRICQRAFKTSLLKKANRVMTGERLDCAEDAYQMFVYCALAKSEATNNNVVGLTYNYGLGLNGQSEWSVSKFVKVAKAFSKCADEIDAFAQEFNKEAFSRNARTARSKLMDLLFNDWHTRVAGANKIESAKACLEFLKDEEVSEQVSRCARDDAYSALLAGKVFEDCDEIVKLIEFAEGVAPEKNSFIKETESHFDGMRKKVEDEQEKDERNRLLEKFNAQKELRIFVSAHKEVDLFDSEILQPVQVGASRVDWRFPWALQDDEGKNISDLNPMYCELTAQYWAWKNVDCERYGFCHYRRYFNFADVEFKENPFGEIIENRINKMTQEKFGLFDENMLKQVEGYDIVTTKFQDLRLFPGKFSTPRQHWHEAPNLHDEDLDLMVDILKEMYPDYADACDTYLNGNKTCFCNMFVMTKEIFSDYCPWLFGILEEFCKRANMANYSKEALRTAGHLAERLLNIYTIKHQMDGSNWKHKQVQCVHFEKPDMVKLDAASFIPSEEEKQTIPVVFAADNNYVPVLTTAIYSMCKNASVDYKYDVVVLTNNIAPNNQEMMKEFFSHFENVSLRFFNVDALIEGYELTTSNQHISNETYYRFLIQEVLPEYDKVVYLDSDMIVEGDVSEIFNVDMGDNLVAAVKDIDFLGNLNFQDNERIMYNKRVLHMEDPYSYFQAGTLVFNTRGLRELHPTETWMEFACDSTLIYNDQDILNRECEGRVTYLPMDWNVMHNCGGRIEKVFTYAPACELDNYFAARNNPKVVHFAGFEKPWTFAEVDLQEHFWKYARQTPFYETLLGKRSPVVVTNLDERIERHQRLYHPILHVASLVVRKLRARR